MGGEAMPDPLRRIVVGVDRTGASVAAMTWAAREAALRGVVLHAVHAWQPPDRERAPYAPGPRRLDGEADRRAAEEALTGAVREALAADGRSADGVVLEVMEGRPVPVLLRCAAGAELLILGGASAAAGSAPVPDHVGPVARACLRAAPCPVVVVTQWQVAGLRDTASRRLAAAAAW
ncbi:MAG: universal stress protein [Streptosporangiales bacterium]